MEIKEFKSAKRDLEAEMASELNRLVKDFKEETGYAPHEIIVDITLLTEMGGETNFVITGTKTHIQL